jgi:hypothetical protein
VTPVGSSCFFGASARRPKRLAVHSSTARCCPGALCRRFFISGRYNSVGSAAHFFRERYAATCGEGKMFAVLYAEVRWSCATDSDFELLNFLNFSLENPNPF